MVSIPNIIFMPFLGVIVEKVNRKKAMIFCDFFTSFIYISLFIIAYSEKMQILILLIASMITNVLSSSFEISTKVIFTEINSIDTIERFNGIKSFCDNCSALIGPVIGTILFTTYGFKIIILIVSTSYCISAIVECFISYQPSCVQKQNQDKKLKLGGKLLGGLHFIAKNPNILSLFILVMALNFFVANNDEIINPGILIQKYKISTQLFGFTSTSMIIGTLVAGLLIFKNKKYNLIRHIRILFILNSLIMIMIGLFSLLLFGKTIMGYFYIFLILQFTIGFITTCINIPLSSYFQISVPFEFLGRFFSLLSFSSSLLIPLGISYTGLLASRVGADWAYIVNNSCVIIVVIFVFAINKTIGKTFKKASTDREIEISKKDGSLDNDDIKNSESETIDFNDRS